MKFKFWFLFLIFILTGCVDKSKTLRIYNYGDYLDEKVLNMFTDETGIKINYDTFAVSEDAYTKIKNGGANYDVVIISDYMAERMIKENLLEPLDFSLIPNYSFIHPRFKNLDFDPQNKFSMPYMWGSIGILYNKTLVEKPVSWSILWDKKYKNQIFMYDNPRDSIAVALKKLHCSLNTRDIKNLNKAKDELIEQKKIVQAYVGDAVKDKMIGNEGALAVVYSGDALFCQNENPDLDYVIPIEGSNVWFDVIVIPKDSSNKFEANTFINFLARPDIALMNTNYINYSTVNSEALKNLPPKIRDNKIYWLSDEDFGRCEIYHDLGNFIKQYNIIWTEVLAQD